MPSDNGSQELPPRRTISLAEALEHFRRASGWAPGNDLETLLTTEQQQALAGGEPYCYRCGRPASSFSEYAIGAEGEHLANAWQYVIQEEGTYNPDTNRFACDACYIAIGMPVGEPGNAYGWRAP